VDCAEEQEGPAQDRIGFLRKTLVRCVANYTRTMRAAGAVVKGTVRTGNSSDEIRLCLGSNLKS
jgi:hypothetical protein